MRFRHSLSGVVVVVRDDKVLGAGWTPEPGEPEPEPGEPEPEPGEPEPEPEPAKPRPARRAGK